MGRMASSPSHSRAAFSIGTAASVLTIITTLTISIAAAPTAAAVDASPAEVEAILKDYGLPGGLLPATVKSYSLSENGKFEVKLSSSCTTKIGSEQVKYGSTITGQLSYGKISGLGGIQAHEFFWVAVTGIEMDGSDPNVIWFKVGVFSKSLSVKLFDQGPSCNSLSEIPELGAAVEMAEMEEMEEAGEDDDDDEEDFSSDSEADEVSVPRFSQISEALSGSAKYHVDVPNAFDVFEATRKVLHRVLE